ncbi:tatD DNase family protein [Rhodotorula toruloides]|uniref:TatD DNase family protein n=1 Tax=Rhodotorula toruloides TaxID=5286 RepID=A0A511KCZ5_RHOTO|nr:tatD DNase family protein [Rhodotorula toruloides]
MAVPRLIDIGSNLGDPVFRGSYHGKQSHPDDFADILGRARRAGVGIQMLTGDCLESSKEVLALAQQHRGLYATIGCHPCRAIEMDKFPGGPEVYMAELDKLIVENKGKRAVAVGENFPPQLELASKHDLPLFLHSRNCHTDFVSALKAHGKPLRGVVHSHTGTAEEALELVEMGFFIGINGCSLKTEENLDVVKRISLDRLMVESDCPWCAIRPSSAAYKHLTDLVDKSEFAHLKERYMPAGVKKEKWTQGKAVKGRNEPCCTGQVAWVVSKLKGISLEEVAETTRRNTLALFGPAGMCEDEGVWGEEEQGKGGAGPAE